MSFIGERVKQRRKETAISLTELANKVGISKGYLHSIESGDTQNPSAEVLFRIANELGTTIADLLGEEQTIASDVDPENIPEALKRFAENAELPEVDKQMLARIEYRGRRPQTEDDWRFLYESIKRSVRDD
jgi:transcriptional regulator with XRE-family HTH domain